MIIFKNNRCLGGYQFESKNSINSEKINSEGYELTSQNWILNITEGLIGLFDAKNDKSIPCKTNETNKNYSLFWKSELTIVFRDYQYAMDYLRKYQGPYERLFKGLYITKNKQYPNTRVFKEYMDFSKLDMEYISPFEDKLRDLAYSSGLAPKKVLNIMKGFILGNYASFDRDNYMKSINNKCLTLSQCPVKMADLIISNAA